MRMDSHRQGYQSGDPDLELKCELINCFSDVLAIENPDAYNNLNEKANVLYRTTEQNQYNNII